MTLIEQIKADQLQARKDRFQSKSDLLTTLIGEACMLGKNDGNREVTDAEVITVIKKFLKGVEEMIQHLKNANIVDEKMTGLVFQRQILESYLPKQLTEGEIKVRLMHGPTLVNKGLMMKYLKENFAGQYDGKVAAKVIDELLK